jgi:iron(III) transport system permease protein
VASGSIARASARAIAPRLRRPDPIVVLASVSGALILGLLAIVVWIGFFYRNSTLGGTATLENYVAVYSDPFALRAGLNTIQMSVATVVVAFALGVPIAWLVERSDMGLKSTVNLLMVVGILIPGFFTAMGWILLVHLRIGAINVWLQGLLGLREGPINIANPIGMGFVLGLGLSALVYALTASSLRTMDPALEEAAQASGAGFVGTLRLVTLPLAWPALLASLLYTLTIAIAAFDVPLVIGLANQVYTFSTYVFVKTQPLNAAASPEYGVPAAFSTLMVFIGISLTFLYTRTLSHARRYQIIRGRGYRPKPTALGPWRPLAWTFIVLYMLATRLGPFLLLVWAAAQPFFRPPSIDGLQFMSLKHFTDADWNGYLTALGHTAVLMIAAPSLALAMSLLSSWVVLRTHYRFRALYDQLAFLPHAIPSPILGLAAAYVALYLPGPIDLHGSMAILVIVLAISQLSFGSRVTNSALVQISDELEEAAYVAGARRLDMLRAITLPLVRPAIVYAWLWMALFATRELTLATMLFGRDNITLPFFIWGTWNTNSVGDASAMIVVTTLLLLPLIAVYLRVTRLGRSGF